MLRCPTKNSCGKNHNPVTQGRAGQGFTPKSQASDMKLSLGSQMVPGGIPFAMLSDPGGEVGKVYGVYDEAAGVDIRGRFLIDPDGIIQAMEVMTPPVGRNFEELVRQILAFQHVRNSEGTEATPAGWRPGEPTLKPRPELVGKVWKEWKPK